MESLWADSLYEAAVNAEMWTEALERILPRIGAASGEIFIYERPDLAPRVQSTSYSRDILGEWLRSGAWQNSLQNKMMRQVTRSDFQSTPEIVTPEQWRDDPTIPYFARIGLFDQLFCPLPLPTGEVVYFSFERLTKSGRFSQTDKAFLNGLLPHFSRAAMISARLRLERAKTTADALDILGLPAAILGADGRVLATNAHFLRRNDIFLDVAFGRLAIADPQANNLFQKAAVEQAATPVMRSIPARARDSEVPLVIHVVPLKRTAHDIFSNGDFLIVATEAGAPGEAPDKTLLCAMFDLSPAEANFCRQLALGDTVSEAAARLGLTESTGRTYLARIFSKTGRNRQADLVSLLRDVGRVPLRHSETKPPMA